jgi:hypothetical protein
MNASPDSHSYSDRGGSTTDAGTREETLDRERLFELLSNRRRRFALHYLKRHADEQVEMGDLSTQVAAWEQGVSPEQVSYDDRKTVHTALYQHHAPKLDRAGVVTYDASRGEIALTGAGESVDLSLDPATERERSWAMCFTVLSVLGGFAALGGWLGVDPLSVVPSAIWGVAVPAGFLMLSLAFVYDTRDTVCLDVEGPPPEVAADRDAGNPQ